ncbi:cob(I)yrinic acid a,c-diamide adenosyltransferase [Thiovibrio sp. JS02]
MAPQGLIIVNTGNGKGKTTAAIGQAIRAAGHGMRVCIIQFIKGRTQTGEAIALEQAFAGRIELHITGCGFTWQQEKEKVKAAALAGWRLAREKISSDAFEMVILEELTYLIHFGLVEEAEIIACLKERPGRQHVVITGRNASPALVECADLVTEMREVKHPYRQGILGQKGIEF